MTDQRAPGPRQESLTGEGRVSEVARIYSAAGALIRRLVQAAGALGRPLTRRERDAVQREIGLILSKAADRSEAIIRLGVAEAATQGALVRVRDQRAERILRANLQRPLQELASREAHRAGTALRAQAPLVGRRTDDMIRAVGLQSTLERLERGQDTRKHARGLASELERRGLLREVNEERFFVDRRGRHYRPDHYATLVARTTTREARSYGTVLAMEESGADLVRVSEHPGGDIDDICIPYEGKVFSLSGSTPGFPHLPELPPFHPNCRHVLLPHSPLNP